MKTPEPPLHAAHRKRFPFDKTSHKKVGKQLEPRCIFLQLRNYRRPAGGIALRCIALRYGTMTETMLYALHPVRLSGTHR